jgi:hypothetical protein
VSQTFMLALVLIGAGAVSSSAQTPVIPPWASPSHNMGLSLHATFALGDGEIGKQKAGALTAGYAREKFRVTGSVGRAGSREDLHEGTTVFGANASWRFKSSTSPALSFDLQTGAGGGSFDLAAGGTHGQLNVPLGVGAAFLAPSPLGNIELWAAARAQLRRSKLTLGSVEERDTNVGGGLAAGLEFTSLHGLGAHLGADWLRIRSAATREGQSEWSVAAGIHYRWLPLSWGQ